MELVFVKGYIDKATMNLSDTKITLMIDKDALCGKTDKEIKDMLLKDGTLEIDTVELENCGNIWGLEILDVLKGSEVYE